MSVLRSGLVSLLMFYTYAAIDQGLSSLLPSALTRGPLLSTCLCLATFQVVSDVIADVHMHSALCVNAL